MDDTIYRKDALATLRNALVDEEWEYAKRAIEILPSAQPDVDKQKLIRTITAGIIATSIKDAYSCGMRNGMRWCKALLEEDAPKFEDASLYAQPEPRWIPCESKLPDVRQWVLCYCRAGIMDALRLTEDGSWEKIYPRVKYMQSFVIAWMPLPKPYERSEG